MSKNSGRKKPKVRCSCKIVNPAIELMVLQIVVRLCSFISL